MSLFQTLLWSLPFIILCLFCAGANLNRRYRARQVWMPAIALVYCILAMIGRAQLLRNLNEWTDGYRELIQFFSRLGMDVNPAFIEIYVFNTLLISVFLFFKGFLLGWMYLTGGRKSAAQQVYMRYYRLDPDVRYVVESDNGTQADTAVQANNRQMPPREEDDAEVWLLKKDYKQFAYFYRGFYIALFAVSCVLFFLSQYTPEWDIFHSVFYPVFGIIILGEVVFFLSGLEEPDANCVKQDTTAKEIPASTLDIRKKYRSLFRRRILKDDVNDSFVPEDKKKKEKDPKIPEVGAGVSDLLKKYDESENPIDRLVAGYFNAIDDELDVNYISCSRELVAGNSVVVYTPFYQDLTHYVMLPIIRQILRFKKCLVVVGRDSAVEDVRLWIEKGVSEVLDTGSLWHVDILNDTGISADIGILRFCDIYRLEIQRANTEFLSQVGFVLLLEPSRILATGQIGLNLLIGQCGQDGEGVTYCACDRNCDGLVDGLSHALRTSFTEVMATPVNHAHHNIHTYWNADGDYLHHKILPEISHYLGVGTEIAAVAWKNHIFPVKWLSCDKFPVVDMKWIVGQYFRPICKYADIPVSQSELYDRFQVDPNLWNGTRQDKLFYIVEDEYKNLFEMTRIYSSRATSEGYIHILSEHYMLRDYMVDNVELFVTDPKAVPAIVPDYARTERNTILKIVMMMSTEKVSRAFIEKEFELCGISTQNLEDTLRKLIKRHCGIKEEEPFSVLLSEESLDDGIKQHLVQYYEIRPSDPLYAYAERLKAAYYVSEDEHGEKYYIGAKLYGHVYQSFLPGQFITSNGKYYQVQQISSDTGVIVRRAADHITQRQYYRQIRDVEIRGWVQDTIIGSQKKFGHLELTRGFADISIHTHGYLQMHSPSDFAHAKRIDINQIPDRKYLNKQVLKIRTEGATEAARYTICLLLNEIFSTIYSDASAYVFAITQVSPENKPIGMLRHAIYGLNEGENTDECIYIVEDSEIDLGLIVSVERYITRFLGIIWELLDWHLVKMAEPQEPVKDDELEKGSASSGQTTESEGFWTRFIRRLKEIFFGTPVPKPPVESSNEDESRTPKEWKSAFEPTQYQQNCFLKFGFPCVPDSLNIRETLSWLNLDGYNHNPLQMVRLISKPPKKVIQSRQPYKFTKPIDGPDSLNPDKEKTEAAALNENPDLTQDEVQALENELYQATENSAVQAVNPETQDTETQDTETQDTTVPESQSDLQNAPEGTLTTETKDIQQDTQVFEPDTQDSQSDAQDSGITLSSLDSSKPAESESEDIKLTELPLTSMDSSKPAESESEDIRLAELPLPSMDSSKPADSESEDIRLSEIPLPSMDSIKPSGVSLNWDEIIRDIGDSKDPVIDP